MAKLVWDASSQRLYETGISNGVIYPMLSDGSYGNGAVWNGLTAVNHSPSGGEFNSAMADNRKYLNLPSREEFQATLEAYAYPDEFADCIGQRSLLPGLNISGQKRKKFGLCYRTIVGNDTRFSDYGYKLHIIYGIMADPSERQYKTVNDSPEVVTYSWNLTATPISLEGFRPIDHLELISYKIGAARLQALEDILYGDDHHAPRLPLPDELATFHVYDPITDRNGDPITTRAYDNITTRVAVDALGHT